MTAPPTSAATAAWYTTPAAPSGPPCQHGSKCWDADDCGKYRGQHRDDCAMSIPARARRGARIDALTPGELHALAVFMSGWSPTGTDIALDDADAVRGAVVLRPGDMPEGAL